jgi:hypothetical protein
MPARLYNAAYRVWPATFANHLPHSTRAPRPLAHSPTPTILELEPMANHSDDNGAANNGFAAAPSTNGRAVFSTSPAT